MTLAHHSLSGLGSGQITASSNSTASPLFAVNQLAMSTNWRCQSVALVSQWRSG